MRKTLRSPVFRTIVALVVGGIFLYLAFREVSLREVWIIIQQAEWLWLCLALAMVGVNTCAKVVRWRVLLGEPGRKVSSLDLLMAILAGQMLNLLLPVRVGDLGRAYAVGSLGAGRAYTLGTIVVEKILDLVWYALLFGLLVVLIPLPDWMSSSGYSLALAAVVLLLAAVLMAFQRQRLSGWLRWGTSKLPARFGAYLESRLDAALQSLDLFQKPGDLLWANLWSAVVWVSAVLTNQLVLWAMGLQLNWVASLLLLAVLQAGISFTNVPGRIGVFEAICILVLGLYGVDRATALAYGLVLHVVVFLPTTLAGIAGFFYLGLGRKEIYRLPGMASEGKNA